jgi:hypothetical protein
MPLNLSRLPAQTKSTLLDYSMVEKRQPSKMYRKHLQSLKKHAGISLLIPAKQYNIVTKHIVHSRIFENFDKLYDTSPDRKKKKLMCARLNSQNSASVNRNSNKSESCMHSALELEHVLKDNNSRICLRKYSLENNVKNRGSNLRKSFTNNTVC